MDDCVLAECSNDGCNWCVHHACFESMRAAFDAENSFSRVVCGKRCYNALIKKARAETGSATSVKKRVRWQDDGPTRHVSSLTVLVDWLTAGDNYNRYRGGDSQCGDTKQVLAQQVVQAIAAPGITTARAPKDVLNRITILEGQYKLAADWLAGTGQGMTDERQLRAPLLERCSCYYELHPALKDRLTTRPKLLSTDVGALSDSDDDDGDASASDSEARTNSDDSRSTATVPRSETTSIPTSIAPKPEKKQRTSKQVPQTTFVQLK